MDSVNQFIKHKPYAAHIYGKVFTLSNKRRSEYVETVVELRNAIECLASDNSYEVPVLWYKFKEELKKTGKDWMVWSDVLAFGQEAGIVDGNALKSCLEFFHSAGDLYFDSSSTSGFVVLDPQWLINTFKEVISIPKAPANILARFLRPNQEKPIMFDHESLTKIWPQQAVDPLIAIMERFALLLHVPGTYKLSYVQEQHHDTKYYIVPSLLPSKATDDKKQITAGPPMMLVPRNGFLPIGTTSRLIASLTNEDGWNVVGDLFRNSATFCPQGSKVTVTVTQNAGMIEVTGNQHNRNTSHLLTQALDTIGTKLCQLNRQEPFTAGIYCSKCRTLIKVELHGSLESYTICPHRGCLNDPSEYSMWFTRSEGHSEVNGISNRILY